MRGGDDNTLSLVETTGGEGIFIEAPHLVLVLESGRPLAAPARLSLVGLDRVAIGRGAARAHRRLGASELAVDVPDGWMSSRHALIRRVGEGFILEDLGSKNGTSLNGAKVGRSPLADGDVVEAGGTLFLFRRQRTAPSQLAGLHKTPPASRHPALTTLSLELERRLESLIDVAASDVPVLVCGETGTGKELAARAVHERSGRRGAFQAVNCGALPAELVESELFGSRRGAFSGAADRLGHVRAAHGGTLFLDEIAELRESAQAALLRVLQEREVTPLGDTRAVPVDFRVVAASQRPLAELAAAGSFRADLYARLAGMELELLPLRHRREDLGSIVGSLIRRLAGPRADAVSLKRAAARALLCYAWPHNIRELEQALAAALALARDRPIALADLPRPIREYARAGSELSAEDQALKQALVEALALTRGNVSATARRLGKARAQIHRWCRRFDVDPHRFRPHRSRS